MAGSCGVVVAVHAFIVETLQGDGVLKTEWSLNVDGDKLNEEMIYFGVLWPKDATAQIPDSFFSVMLTGLADVYNVESVIFVVDVD